MFIMYKLFVCAIILVIPWQAEGRAHASLVNQQIWSIKDGSTNAATVLTRLAQEGFVDLLKSNGDEVHFRVFPESMAFVKQELKNYNSVVEVDNLAKYIQEVEEKDAKFTASQRQAAAVCNQTSCTDPLLTNYMSFQQMEWYLQSIAKNYPKIVNLTSLAKTKEGRNVWMVKLCSNASVANKSIWIEGGIHAREWISPAVTLQLLNNLVKNVTLLNGVDFYFVPMSNPDGYVYSQTTNRLWRKNKAVTSNALCPGVDLNRNWDFHRGVGASADPCSEIYYGPVAFSEPETKGMSIAIAKIKNMRLSVAIHSYSQDILYPWGWTGTAAPNTPAQIALGNEFSTAVSKVNGRVYKVLNSATGLYYASGTTDDWVQGVQGVKYSYTLELGDTGTYGFVLPASQIAPYVKEIWAGFLAMINRIKIEA